MAPASTWTTLINYSALFSASTVRASSRAQALASRPCSASPTGTAGTSGLKARYRKARPSFLVSPISRRRRMENKVILLVEDNARDEALTLRALKKSNIVNDVIVARDGVEALDYLFGTGAHAGRDLGVMPQMILLDLKLPKV